MTPSEIASLNRRIEAVYWASGNRMGWRLLASPVEVLNGAEIAFIGMNPAGTEQPAEHGEFAMARGSAYVNESWGEAPPGKSRLQLQVRALFRRLSVRPEEVLAGNLVPFLSPRWSELANSDAALQFGYDIWGDLIRRARPHLVIGMGRPVTEALHGVLGTRGELRVPLGWGKITGSRAEFDRGAIVGLPQLSRFGVVSRPQSQRGLQTLFHPYWH